MAIWPSLRLHSERERGGTWQGDGGELHYLLKFRVGALPPGCLGRRRNRWHRAGGHHSIYRKGYFVATILATATADATLPIPSVSIERKTKYSDETHLQYLTQARDVANSASKSWLWQGNWQHQRPAWQHGWQHRRDTLPILQVSMSDLLQDPCSTVEHDFAVFGAQPLSTIFARFADIMQCLSGVRP